MSQLCRVFWDFYGPDSKETAQHFLRHVVELIQREDLSSGVVKHDVEVYHSTHAAAYCDANLETGKQLAIALKSKRSVMI